MSGLGATLIEDAAEVEALEADWRRLWQAQPRREVFTGFDWNMAAWQPISQRAAVVVVRRGNIVVGLLALSAGPDGLRFMSGPNADYNDMLVAGTLILTPCWLWRCTRWPSRGSSACWTSCPTGPGCARPRTPAASDLRSRLVVEAGQPCPALRLQPDRIAVLDAMVNKKSLKRHDKKLAQQGDVELVHLDTRDRIHAALPDFFAQHIARRALAGERSLFVNDAPRRFYRALVDRFDPAQELRFAVLNVGGRPVAYHFGFEVDGRFTWYKPSFDVDYWDYGAGEVLLRRLFEYVRERPVVEFDFTRGGEGFKDRFTNHQGRNMRWTLHGSAVPARIALSGCRHPRGAEAQRRRRSLARQAAPRRRPPRARACTTRAGAVRGHAPGAGPVRRRRGQAGATRHVARPRAGQRGRRRVGSAWRAARGARASGQRRSPVPERRRRPAARHRLAGCARWRRGRARSARVVPRGRGSAAGAGAGDG